MNSLQPSWEANEEEAADGGQSAFMRLFGAIEMAYIYTNIYNLEMSIGHPLYIYIYMRIAQITSIYG